MFDQQDDLRVIQGARLADKEPPEKLDEKRAYSFVSRVMKDNDKVSTAIPKRGIFSKRVIRGSVFLSLAAALALLFWVSSYPLRHGSVDGTPAVLHENHDIHASKAAVDSTAFETDSLELPVGVIVK